MTQTSPVSNGSLGSQNRRGDSLYAHPDSVDQPQNGQRLPRVGLSRSVLVEVLEERSSQRGAGDEDRSDQDCASPPAQLIHRV